MPHWRWIVLSSTILNLALATNSSSVAVCLEQSTNEINPVLWPNSFVSSRRVVSNPMCLTESQKLITRLCSNQSWFPKQNEVPNCHSIQSRPALQYCPPEYTGIADSKGNILFCYHLSTAESWNYPCFTSGSSMTVLDLDTDDLAYLVNKLSFTDRKLVWLPARRIRPYGPLVWTIPGEDWGKAVKLEDLKFTRLPVTQSCLLLDLDKNTVKTDNCTYKYPSLCIASTSHLLPLHCPSGYQASRYGYNDGKCYGLETVEDPMTWEDFKSEVCPQPLQVKSPMEHNFLQQIKDSDSDCWMGLVYKNDNFMWYPDQDVNFVNWDAETNFTDELQVNGIINERFRWLLKGHNTKLDCMVCEVHPNRTEVELSLDMAGDSDSLLLTIYYPRELWRENDDYDDIGVQCFTNAEGFVKRVEIDDEPYLKVNYYFKNLMENKTGLLGVEKVVHEVSRINDEAGEYWCQGHGSRNFNFITTSGLLVPSKNKNEHIFVLLLRIRDICPDQSICNPEWDDEIEYIKKMLNANKVRIMQVNNLDVDGSAEVVFHVSVKLLASESCSENSHCSIVKTFRFLYEVCETVFSPSTSYELISLKSTAYCLPVENDDEFSLHWELTPIGDNTAPKEFCMQSNGLPVTRKCAGTFLAGGKWASVMGSCSKDYEPTNRTTFLYSLAKGKTDIETISSFLTHDLLSILDDKQDLIPADIYFLAMSLKTIVEISNSNSSLIDVGDTKNIAMAIDSIMNIEEDFLSLAQTMNSSNILLEALENIFTKISSNNSEFPSNESNGLDISITPLFMVQISEPAINNISGLALVRPPGSNSTLFTELEIRHLTLNTTVYDVLAMDGLEIATWVTQDLLHLLNFRNRSSNSSVGNNQTNPKIIVEMFYNDVVFQETKEDKDIVNSRVVSVSIPGYNTDLTLPLPLVFRRFDKNETSDRPCVYWDFNALDEFSLGQWSKRGCYHVAGHEELDVCACFHLTNFAQLVLGNRGGGENGTEVIITYHGRALNAITLVGCSLSLVGVAGIVTTAVLFRAWRQKPGTKVLLHLSAAIAMQSIMMLAQDSPHESDAHCIALGVFMHYSVLSAFMWMLLTALLQFARYVKVLGTQRPPRFMMKFSLVGWGLPLIPVVLLLLVDRASYLPPPFAPPEPARDPAALCYPQGVALYLTVLLPVACIVATNLTVFILVVRSISRGPDGKPRPADPKLASSQLRLSVSLFFLLGLSWIFGLLAVTGGEILFSYLFCLTATLQGFVLFVYFVVCDPATRMLWVSLVRTGSLKDVSG